jgi:acylphosphatase
MTDMGRFHARVSGDVQGVGFRAFVMQRALMLQLNGWVRNLSDGDVEVLAEGKKEILQQLLNELQIGPSASSVGHVEARWESFTGEFVYFSIR